MSKLLLEWYDTLLDKYYKLDNYIFIWPTIINFLIMLILRVINLIKQNNNRIIIPTYKKQYIKLWPNKSLGIDALYIIIYSRNS